MKRDFQNIRRWIACLCAILMTTAPLLSCGGGNGGGYTVHTVEYDKYHRYGCGNTGDRTGDG